MVEYVSGFELVVGDRVWSKNYGHLGTVIEIRYLKNDPSLIVFENFKLGRHLFEPPTKFARKVREESYVVECII